MNQEPIYVTRPDLPPINDLLPYLEKIWESRILTNGGPFHQELERQLCDYLGVKYLSLFANGTLALVTALQVLNITGEVITTPYSFVATTHALWWNNIKPVFVDIEQDTYNLDPYKIEAAITPKTTAILPVHVYGNPCDVHKLKEVAEYHGLKVIYDACHTFGVTLDRVPILNFGDLSVMSFHATKTFHTFEGGAIVCHDETTKKKIDYLKNFGFENETIVVMPGINAKMNEFQAAIGLLQLKRIDSLLKKREQISNEYRRSLEGIRGLSCIKDNPSVRQSYSYFPIFINEKEFGRTRDKVYELLKMKGINGRRYFYPLISQFPPYSGLSSAKLGKMSIAERAASEVICLPIYPTLKTEAVKYICDIIKITGVSSIIKG